MYEASAHPLSNDLFSAHQNKKRLSALLHSRLSDLADELYAKVQARSSKSTGPESFDPAIDRWANEGGDMQLDPPKPFPPQNAKDMQS